MNPPPRPSLAYGPEVDNANVSHLQLWQKVVNTQPNNIALISRHQDPSNLQWISDPHSQQTFVRWTYAELDRAARNIAFGLSRMHKFGRRPITVLLYNQAEWALYYWAAAYLNLPFVPINPKTAARKAEISHMIHLINPVVIIVADEDILKQLEENLPTQLITTIPISMIKSIHGTSPPVGEDPILSRMPATVSLNDVAVILFTSGTTSLPKPCTMTSFQCLNAALSYMEARGIKSRHRFIQHLPGFHSYGMAWSLGVWLKGATVIFPSDSFEPHASLQCIDLFQATHIALVPIIAQAILSHPSFPTTNLRHLAALDISGAGILSSLIEACEAFTAPVCTSYGMTESPATLIWPVGTGSVVRGEQVTSGNPSKGAIVKICSPETRDIVPRGQAGELHCGGVQVTPRYWGTAILDKCFYRDKHDNSWIVSGDQAIMDADGAVTITGRYKDLIIRGGENISPARIEEFFNRQNGVETAYVVGVPDEVAGEVPIVVIATKPGRNVDLEHLKQAALRDLGPALAPTDVLHLWDDLRLDAFATTASGKVRKCDLAKSVREWDKKFQAMYGDDSEPTIDRVLNIWKKITGNNGLMWDSEVAKFADSLMIMQLSGIVKREFSKDVKVEEFRACKTIQGQADLIDERHFIIAANHQPRCYRELPSLKSAAIPHLANSTENFFTLRNNVSTMLEPFGRHWRNVEDVVPLPDWCRIFCHPSRPSSWNLRFLYQTTVGIDNLERAIKKSLIYHPTMRSMALRNVEGNTLLVTMQPDDWDQVCMNTDWVVERRADLNSYLLDDSRLNNAVAPGPLVRFHLVKVRSDGTSGLIVVASHAVIDMCMTRLWLEDVIALLKNDTNMCTHGLFKHYATAFYQHRSGKAASMDVDYWAYKLQGVGSLREAALWPRQRAPEWFKGDDTGWSRWNGTKARETERQTTLLQKRLAQRGIRKSIPVSGILQLKSEHNVPVFMLVKAAIAILNVMKTGAKEAVFGTINAGRTWPFNSAYSISESRIYSANPLDISGCTTEYVLDRIPVSGSETILAFMQRVTRDEEQNSIHVHAPFFRIMERLKAPVSPDDTRNIRVRERDAEALLPLIRRQSFNWLPTPPTDSSSEILKLQEMLSCMDNGLTITGFLAEDKRSVVLSFNWDAEHLDFPEAQGALDDLAILVERMGRWETWSHSVDELIAEDVEEL